MSKCKCIKGFSVEKCDDNGFTLENEYEVIEEENISEFADYLIENASCAFEHQDRELLEKVLRDYKKIK